MYEIAMFVLHIHDALMALDFQNSLLVVIQKKKSLPLFSYKSNFKDNVNSTSKSNN